MPIDETCDGLNRTALLLTVLLLLPTFRAAEAAEAIEIDGFTEPYRTINVAAADAGLIQEIDVREGQRVERDQILAVLESELFHRSLAIAEEEMNAEGRLKSARAQLELCRERLRKFEDILASGHARPDEVARARMEWTYAEGNLLTVQEELQVKTLDYQRIKAQIERRKIRSPINGYVRQIHKEKGEFAAPNDPTVLTIVQLDVLLATFSVPSEYARNLTAEQPVTVRIVGESSPVRGVIDVLDPVNDAKSGSVLVKVRIDNTEGRYRGGERCSLCLEVDTSRSAGETRSRPRFTNTKSKDR